MPKNKGKGGKNRRRGKNENDVMKRELIKKDDSNQAYAQVLKMLGNGRLTAFCFDGKARLCHIRGKLRKKVWINVGDIILVGLRDYQDDKVRVIHIQWERQPLPRHVARGGTIRTIAPSSGKILKKIKLKIQFFRPMLY